jgi:predicted amidohydrolase YtcJ
MSLTIYPGRVVRTMDPARPTAEAVAVAGDRIRAVGSLEELRQYGEAVVDDRYADSVLFPGFVEAHAHTMGGALWRHTYVGFHGRLSPDGRHWAGCQSIDAVVARLREADAELADPREPLLAWGLDPIYFDGERLDRRHLDAVSRERPILVVHQSFHASTANSAILETDEITADSAVEGVVKDGSGQLTGELREPVAMGLVRSVPSLLAMGFDADAVRGFGDDARNHAVTTIVDLGNTALMEDDAVAGLHEVVDDPSFPARVSVFHMGGGLAAGAEPAVAVERLLELRKGNTDSLRFGHVKLVLDGSIQGFTARLQPPGYLPDDRSGIWLIPPPAFAEMFDAFHRAGLMVHVHCNGDEATELFLDTVEAALQRHPRWDHRHTVTHSQLTTPAQYRRMAALGMCANIFSNHLWFWGDQHRDLTLGPDRASRMDAAATALRAGVPISLHSDSPVTPLDPLATASYAASRRTSSGKVLGEHERITVPQALHAMTLGAAYMLKMDHEVGSLEAGKYADLAVLDRDPFEVDPDALRDVEVRASIVGGRHFKVGGQT